MLAQVRKNGLYILRGSAADPAHSNPAQENNIDSWVDTRLQDQVRSDKLSQF